MIRENVSTSPSGRILEPSTSWLLGWRATVPDSLVVPCLRLDDCIHGVDELIVSVLPPGSPGLPGPSCLRAGVERLPSFSAKTRHASGA